MLVLEPVGPSHHWTGNMSFRANSEASSIPRVGLPADPISGRAAERPSVGIRLADAWNAALRKFPSLLALERIVCSLSPRKFDSNGLRAHHLDQAQMLSYLDGELGPGTAEASAHLQSCWSCRSEMRGIHMQIRSFLADRNAHLPQPSCASTERIWELRRRLIHDGH